MECSSKILFCLGLLLLAASFQGGSVYSQDFPYAVPQAPEFDGEGNQADSQAGYPEVPRKRSKRRAESFSPNGQTDVRTVRPYVPQEPQVPAAAARPSYDPTSMPGQGYGSPPARSPMSTTGQGYGNRPTQPSPVASVAAQQPSQAQQRPDCSAYPMMIAQARSEQEMQNAARMYLTCLLQIGWSMEQARQHVITTIETTYRAGR